MVDDGAAVVTGGTKRNHDIVVRGNYKFVFHKLLVEGVKRWVCANKWKFKCKAYLKTSEGMVIEAHEDHNHDSKWPRKRKFSSHKKFCLEQHKRTKIHRECAASLKEDLEGEWNSSKFDVANETNEDLTKSNSKTSTPIRDSRNVRTTSLNKSKETDPLKSPSYDGIVRAILKEFPNVELNYTDLQNLRRMAKNVKQPNKTLPNESGDNGGKPVAEKVVSADNSMSASREHKSYQFSSHKKFCLEQHKRTKIHRVCAASLKEDLEGEWNSSKFDVANETNEDLTKSNSKTSTPIGDSRNVRTTSLNKSKETDPLKSPSYDGGLPDCFESEESCDFSLALRLESGIDDIGDCATDDDNLFNNLSVFKGNNIQGVTVKIAEPVEEFVDSSAQGNPCPIPEHETSATPKHTVEEPRSSITIGDVRSISHPHDPCDIFGDYVSVKLRALKTEHSRHKVELLISDLLYKASIGAFDLPQTESSQ